MSPLANCSYFTRDFQAVDGWHALYWADETTPGKYFKNVMPGWLTITPASHDEHGFNGMYTGAVPISERNREVHAASVDNFDGTIGVASEAYNFYRLLPPGESEPTEAEVLEDWTAWKRSLEQDRELSRRRRERAKAGERP